MRKNKTEWNKIVAIIALAGLILFSLPSEFPVQAGGPLLVGGGSTGGFGPEATPFVFMTLPVPYTTDGGNLGALNNTTANSRVLGMFQVWQNVASSKITFNRIGGVNAALVPDGDVNTVAEYNAIDASCTDNPIIYDVDGSLFSALGYPAGVIGFAGPCMLGFGGDIQSARAALNGNFRDGDFADGFELTDNEFDAVFIHEFGHFFGLDHSQINLNCLSPGCADFSNDAFGLPTMFPFLISGLEETTGVHPARTLSTDDIAWVSFLYPEASFATSFGTITGNVLYSDSQTGVQGANVIARDVANPRRNAVSVVSGYEFTSNPGNPLIEAFGGNPRDPFGSTQSFRKGVYRIPGLPASTYQVEIETINSSFEGGSSVGPLDPPLPLPGPGEFWGGPETNSDNPATPENIAVSAGGTASDRNIIMNGTPPRFDGFDATNRNESSAAATPIGNGTHRLSLSPFNSGDVDFYSFNATAGNTVTVEIVAERAPVNSPMDSVLEILNNSGVRPSTCRDPIDSGGSDFNFNGTADTTPNSFNDPCANDDIDLGIILDSKLEFNAPSTGTYFIHVSEYRGDARPDFQYDLVLSGASQTAPDINSGGTVNGASFTGVVAAGSIASTFGTNLASSTAGAGAVPLPTTLGGATMRINGLAVPKFFASANQVNIQIPWELAGQAKTGLSDSVAGVSGGGELVNLATFGPGLFSTNQAGTGQGAILIFGSGGAVAAPVGMFPGSRPANRGEFIEIYATGLGPVTNQPASGAAASGSPLSHTVTAPSITIGGIPALVTFSGLAPGFVGLYQVNAQVPATAPVGSAVSVVLTIGGVSSNTVTIAVQ
jgi:uncharacterized protein (TIGR03437 family)